jgi:YbbR domain-containing protein
VAREVWARSRTAVRRSPGLAVLSALLGVSLWVFVTEEQNPTVVDIFPVPIAVGSVNVASGIAVANTVEPVQVRLSAPEDRWEQLTSANFRAIADLKGLEAREQKVAVRVEVTGVRSVRVVEVVPSTVLVNLEDFVTREVEVVASTFGTPPLGYDVTGTTPDVTTVEVSGPESLVALVGEVVADVNVTGLTVSLPVSVDLVPEGSSGGEVRGVQVNPPSVRVSVEVEQTTLTRPIPLTPTLIGEPAGGFRVTGVAVFPPTLDVRGPLSELQSLDALMLSPVDVSGQRSSVSRQVSARDVPAGLSAVGFQPVTVLVTIATVEGTLRLELAPEVAGVGEGFAAVLDEDSVEIVIAGPQPSLNELVRGDVRVIADLDGADPGVFEVPARVELPDGLTVVAVRPGVLSGTLILDE